VSERFDHTSIFYLAFRIYYIIYIFVIPAGVSIIGLARSLVEVKNWL